MDLMKIFEAFSRGFYDSCRGTIAILYLDKEINEQKLTWQSPSRVSVRQKETSLNEVKKPKEKESKVLKRVCQCGMLNGGIFLFSILLFEYGLLPAINNLFSIIFGNDSFMGNLVWSWIQPMLSLIFKTVWVIPLFLLSKVVNALWFQDIADSAYKRSRGRPVYPQSLSKLLADSVFSIVIQLLFLLQATLASYIPIHLVGMVLSMVQMCMLYSLYTFEYKWFNMGWELHRRLTFIETNWPYFLGFGLPLAVLTQMPSSWIMSGCIFSMLFPLFIVSGNDAKPVTDSCDYTVHFFSPVISISNLLFSKTIGNPHRTLSEKR
ncbi:unnamed protein product [Acanthoscelides obtectus]|uniref:Etoposide-induced protein 2.4 n=1 Tax=Acanthoscelides obtectus TaxID=200917 RepID=A0A9P0LSR3_ACAOB|nr:unnamed protein product [Acanthoscelides obtectus]CAK1644103.1 Etoposide-induced protein 2.4 homolog [Acanthoscelides obtectus]